MYNASKLPKSKYFCQNFDDIQNNPKYYKINAIYVGKEHLSIKFHNNFQRLGSGSAEKCVSYDFSDNFHKQNKYLPRKLWKLPQGNKTYLNIYKVYVMNL